MEPLAAEDDCEHLTFNVGVSLFAITKGLAGKRDGLPVLNENGAESSAGGVDLDDTLSLWVEVRKGHFTTDERLRRFKCCVVRVRPDELRSFFTRSRRVTVCCDRFGMNGAIYVAMPKHL